MNDPQPDLSLRPATDTDANVVAALYAACVHAGHTHWTNEYPDRTCIEDDLRAHTLYVCEADGRVMGAVSLLPTDDCEELGLPYAAKRPCVLCRLALSPEYQGRGLSKRLLALAEAQALRMGYDGMHLLREEGGERTRRLYEGAGYQAISEVLLYGGHFVAYERLLGGR